MSKEINDKEEENLNELNSNKNDLDKENKIISLHINKLKITEENKEKEVSRIY